MKKSIKIVIIVGVVLLLVGGVTFGVYKSGILSNKEDPAAQDKQAETQKRGDLPKINKEEMEIKLTQDVADGKITQEQADKMKSGERRQRGERAEGGKIEKEQRPELRPKS